MSGLVLGRVQMRIMQVLWNKRKATAQEITDAITEIEPIKHSTVQTFLRILVKKEIVGFEVDKRTFIYFPLTESNEITRDAYYNFINTTFSGSLEGMMSYIVKNVDIPPDQLEKIKKMLDKEDES